jgi:hypothetical protein
MGFMPREAQSSSISCLKLFVPPAGISDLWNR